MADQSSYTITPYILAQGATKLIEFMKAAFGAEETFRLAGPNDRIAHAEMRIGQSTIMLADAPDDIGPINGIVLIQVDDCDAVYKRALAAGATSEREPADQFYGDRTANVIDPAGNRWWIHTHIRDVSPEEMAKGAVSAMQQ